MPQKYLIREFEDFARSNAGAEALMQYVSQRIHIHIPRYNWIGFYLIDKKDSSMLLLGPHTGSFTPEAKIMVGEGLCGLAAATGRVMVTDNVAGDSRCVRVSDLVKSQISAPLMAHGQAAGVLYVESYFQSTFKPAQERDFLVGCANIVQNCLAGTATRVLVNA